MILVNEAVTASLHIPGYVGEHSGPIIKSSGSGDGLSSSEVVGSHRVRGVIHQAYAENAFLPLFLDGCILEIECRRCR